MIIEIAIITAGVVSIFGFSLAFADRILKQQAKQDQENDLRDERRRILERLPAPLPSTPYSTAQPPQYPDLGEVIPRARRGQAK